MRLGARLALWGMALNLAACALAPAVTAPPASVSAPTSTATRTVAEGGPTPLPTRGLFPPGSLLPYVAQSGDTAISVAAHFNTTPAEVLAANPAVSATTTFTPGLRLNVPAYYFPLGGPTFQMMPDTAVIYGPDHAGWDVDAFLQAQPGWLKTQTAYVNGAQRSAAQTLRYIAQFYGVSPRLLLALMEWRSGALTNPTPTRQDLDNPYRLGPDARARGFYLQSLWVAETLSAAYYGWRSGRQVIIPLRDTYQIRVDSYQNAGTMALQALLAHWFDYGPAFDDAVGPDGFYAVYARLWGDPWANHQPHIPGDLRQPALALPFDAREAWAFTGGPHPAFGTRLPWAALDFAPAGVRGCAPSSVPVRAVAPGVVARASDSAVALDLDGDGLEYTGWVIVYFHIAADKMARAGTVVNAGDPLGFPSCEGGRSTGTHVHLSRRYNGEWLPADGLAEGVLPFVLNGWTPVRGPQPYAGRLTRIGAWIEAATTATNANRVPYFDP